MQIKSPLCSGNTASENVTKSGTDVSFAGRHSLLQAQGDMGVSMA